MSLLIDTETLNTGSLLKNSFGEEYFYSVNHSAFEQSPSSVLYQQLFQEQLEAEDTLYLFVGSDSGLLIKYLLKHPPQKGSRFLIIDFPQIIENLPQPFKGDEKQRIYLYSTDEWQEKADKYELENYLFINKVKIIQSYAVIDNHIKQYKQLWKKTEEEINDSRWQVRGKTGTRLFIQTQLENLNENIFSAYLLRDCFKGKTAVILAGGPSLDSYIDWVEENRDRLIVFAVSRIARRLLETSIIPDFFVSIDPNDISFDVSKEVLQFSNKSILLNQYHIVPEIVQQWRGLNFYIGSLYPWITDVQPNYISANGPTVTNVALDTAIYMGFKELLLIGVDLCFSPEGFSHASGSIEHAVGTMSSYTGHLVTTNSGQTAETETSFFNAIKALRLQAQHARKQGVRFINPSPQAVKIDDIEHVLIEDIHLNSTKTDVKKQIASLIPDNLQEARRAHYLAVKKEIQQKQKELKEIIQLTEKALDYNELFFKNNEPEKNFKYKLKIDKIEETLNKKYLELSAVCRFFGTQEFLKFFKPAHDKDMSNDELKQWGDTYYQAYKTGSKALAKTLKQCIKRTKLRLEELDDSPPVTKLLDFWEREQTPGRALILQDMHPQLNKHLNSRQQQQMTEAINHFRQIISGGIEQSFQYQRIKKLYELNGTELKALNLFQQQDKAGLERILSSLEHHPDKAAEPLKHLVLGFLAELDNNTNQALLAYQNAIEEPALEIALRQIVVIAIENHNFLLAEKAIEQLCESSLLFLPQLARIYKIQKRYKDALDAYTLYLEQFPEDLSVMFKLAEFYTELDETEGACFVYQHILELDKNNQEAKLKLEKLQTSSMGNTT